MQRRVIVIAGALSLVAAACGGSSVLAPATTGTVQATESSVTDPSTTEATAVEPPSSQPVESSVTTGTTPPASVPEPVLTPDLAVQQVMLRYDGVTGAGTFEATVCNIGETAEIQPEVVISVNGVEVVVGGNAIPPMSCRGFFDTSVDLPGFGVTGPGTVNVAVTAIPESGLDDGVSIVGVIEVPDVTVAAPADQLQAYRNCLGSGQNHRNCVGMVPYHPISDAGEIMKVSGRYMVIGPEPYDEVLSYFLADNEICTPRVEGWMGVQGPTPIAHRLVMADDYGGAYAAHFVEIYSVGSEGTWDAANTNVTGWWRGVIDGYCDNGHEMTHLILGDTPMPSWIEEGLATYMEADLRSGSNRPQAAECRATGWYGSLFEGGQAEVPYQNLMVWDTTVPGIYYYRTAMCFWDYLESEYGYAVVRDIVATTASYRDPGFNGCSGLTGTVHFIDDIVNPILGTDISQMTLEKWGFGGTYTACEG